MKRFFLKSGFSAFAFILAVVISFAFSSSPNSEEKLTSNIGYIQLVGPISCQEIETDCVYGNTFNCTIYYDFYMRPVYNYNFNETTCLNRMSFDW